MKIIDRIVRNSSAFKEMEVNIENKMTRMLLEHQAQTTEAESQRVDKILDLTTRVHNTIIGFKHSKLERLVP